MIVFHDLNETSTFPPVSLIHVPTSSHFVIFASRSRPYAVSLASTEERFRVGMDLG